MSRFTMLSSKRCLLLSLAIGALVAGNVHATAPTLFKDPFRQGPVRGDPGDLLLLAGNGFATGDRVAYQKVNNQNAPPPHPASIPSPNTDVSGEAVVVVTLGGSPVDAPYSLAVKLLTEMASNQTYILWVKNAANEWSNGVLINDLRPLWITPDRVYATQMPAGLPRVLKLVGRNLQRSSAQAAQIRLQKIGTTYTLTVSDDGNPATAIERYVAKVTLPATMATGTYAVRISRDGTNWVSLLGQTLTVLADPATPSTFSVSGYGGCSGSDGNDDTACVQSAINAASAAGGGIVSFGAGVWHLGVTLNPAPDKTYGLILPANVKIVGAGSASTTVQRDTNWDAPPLFTLMGSNEVKAITFVDSVTHVEADAMNRTKCFLQLGQTSPPGSWGSTTVVDDVTIRDNVFDNAVASIREGGYPIMHLYVKSNTIAAWYDGILFIGPYFFFDPDRVRFDVQDSIFTLNTFAPGGYVDSTGNQGPIAWEIGASKRVDVSNNVVDGTITTYLHGAPRGFRAGFFYHMSNDHEMLLVSQNQFSCTGDRAGDGEAICYDDNANLLAFSSAVPVSGATSNSVTVTGTLRLTSPSNYFDAHWVQVLDGTGVGQARKITSYTVNGSQVTFNVIPQWDVTPTTSSKVVVVREFWQVYTVDNTVDNRSCALNSSHPDWWTRPESGEISGWGTSSDSAYEGNVQYASDGIQLHGVYNVDPPPNGPGERSHLFVDIHGNTITDEVNYDAYCSFSGVQVDYGASQGAAAYAMFYGLTVSGNAVSHADGLRGGAITLEDGWFAGDGASRLVRDALVFNNSITNLPDTVPTHNQGPGGGACDVAWLHRRGVHLHTYTGFLSDVYRAVLKGNSFPTDLVCKVLDEGSETSIPFDTAPDVGWCPVP